jgi:hypothetical protein
MEWTEFVRLWQVRPILCSLNRSANCGCAQARRDTTTKRQLHNRYSGNLAVSSVEESCISTQPMPGSCTKPTFHRFMKRRLPSLPSANSYPAMGSPADSDFHSEAHIHTHSAAPVNTQIKTCQPARRPSCPAYSSRTSKERSRIRVLKGRW